MRLRTVLDVFYPRSCSVTGSACDPSFDYLSWDTVSEFRLIHEPMCSRCGDPVEGRVDHAFECYQCTKKAPHFERARSAFKYEGVPGRLLRDFKYRQAIWLHRDLASFLEACVRCHFDVSAIDFVCAVPLHPLRRRERGYNQAHILAVTLARTLEKPVLSRCIRRVRATRTQTNLTARDRLTNVRGAFNIRRPRQWPGDHALLVDDVMTTGSTVDECAKSLKQSGVKSVSVVTVARG